MARARSISTRATATWCSYNRADHTALRLLHLQNVRDDTIAAARSAVDDFLNELKLGDERKGYVYPWRPARTMSEAWDEVHIGLCEYIEANVEELGLHFEWMHGGLSRETMRNTFNQPRYQVRICEDGAEELTTGTRGVPTRWKRIPPEVQESGSNQGFKGNICSGMHEIDSTHAGRLQFSVGAICYGLKAMKISFL